MSKVKDLFFKQWKTAAVVVIGVVLNGLVAYGYIEASWLNTVNWILTFLGFGAIRLGINGK